MSNLLVIGASRGIGLETVKAALESGHSVRALARNAHNIALNDPNLEKVDGDALSETDIQYALEGVDAVIQVLGLAMGPAYFKGTTLFSKATEILTREMAKKDIKRLIAITGLGAGDSRGHGGFLYDVFAFPLILKRIYDDKDIQEKIIKDSELQWTIARPGLLKDGPVSGLYQALTDPKDWHAGSITRADVAQFIIDEIERPAFIHQTPLLIT